MSGLIWTYLFIPPPGILSDADHTVLSACLLENKMGIYLKHFTSSSAPFRGTHSIKRQSLGRSCLKADDSMAIVLGTGICKQSQHQNLAQFPTNKAPSISTNWTLLLDIKGPNLGQLWPHYRILKDYLINTNTKNPLAYMIPTHMLFTDGLQWARRGKGNWNAQNTRASKWLLPVNF